MRSMRGCGLYTAGIEITAEGGAFVAVEKRPRKVGTEVVHLDGYDDVEDAYEDDLVVVGAERIHGRVLDMVTTVAGKLNAEPMADDTTAYLDVSELGEPLRRMFSDFKSWPLPLVVGGDQEQRDKSTGLHLVPTRVLQNHVTLALQNGRLSVVEGLADGPTILGCLDKLASLGRGPTRDLAFATAIAIWTADHYRSHGPWASRKPPPPALHDMAWAREARRQAFLRAREQVRKPWHWHLARRGQG